MGGKRRLIAESLIGLNVDAHSHRVLTLGDGQRVFVLLDHIVAFHGAVVGITDGLISLGKLKGGETFISGRKRMEILNPKSIHESWLSWARCTGPNIHVARKTKTRLIEHRWAKSMAPT